MWKFLSLLLLCTVCYGREIKKKEFWQAEALLELARTINIHPIEGVAKNVIIMMGDGMGVETVTAMRIYKGEVRGKPGDETELSFEKFPNVALSKTACTDRMVPDSACATSAFLGGVRTRFGVINVDDRVNKSVCSTHTSDSEFRPITYLAQDLGKWTGIVTTTRVTHASPAGAFGNVCDRDWEDDSVLPADARGRCSDLAAQLIEKGRDINVIFGGGRRNFLDKNASQEKGQRTDGRDLVEEWKADKIRRNLSASYVNDPQTFQNIDYNKTSHVLGLFASSHMKYEEDRKLTNDEPSLTQMTETAIRILSRNPGGFFLFVEGGLIDYGHHANQAKYAITDGLEFDRAVEKAVAMTNPEETLIIVTADHSHVFSVAGYPDIETPLFGINTLDASDVDKMPYTNVVYGNGPGYNRSWPLGRQNLTGVNTQDLKYRAQSAVPLVDETHSGSDVAIYAFGPWAHLFRGVKAQYYIHHVATYAMCLKPHDRSQRCLHHSNHATRPNVTSYSLLFILGLLARCFIE